MSEEETHDTDELLNTIRKLESALAETAKARDHNRTCVKQLERERDEAREQLEAMERAGAEQARRADENREWDLRAERERDEARIHLRHTIDELADEQQAHGLTKGKLTECQMEMAAMREAIKEVSLQLTFAEKVSRTSVLHIYVYDALAKLQPFIQPKP